MSKTNDKLQKGDIVLVTGVTGLIGSSVADALISRGLKVRGVTRDVKKVGLFKEKLEKLYGPGVIMFVQVENASQPDAYKSALQGTSGLVHLALDGSHAFGEKPDVERSIQTSIDMTLNILKTATEVPGFKSAVVTAAQIAHYLPQYGQDQDVNIEVYNESGVKMAHDLPGDHPAKAVLTIVASKTRAEQELWKWVESDKPSFSINTVSPHIVLGPPFNPTPGVYSSSTWATWLFNNTSPHPIIDFFQPGTWIVDVRDAALLHVAALLDGNTSGQKLWAAGHEPIHVNEVLKVWREAYPDRDIPGDVEGGEPPRQGLNREKEGKLLEKYAGRDYIPLTQTLLDTVAGVAST